MLGFSWTAFSTEAAYPRIVGARPGFTFAMIVNPLAGVFGIADPNFPSSTCSFARGKAAASGFMWAPLGFYIRARPRREYPSYRAN